jgi:LmbE family N-acetylglucosaminyl deacetylase
MNIVIIAPHPDDESIGCGGTARLHTQRGDRVITVFLTSGELGLKHLAKEEAWKLREKEAGKAAKVLGLAAAHFLRQPDWFLGEHVDAAAKALVPVLADENPEIIYLPHEKEWHPDHKASLPIVRAAMKHLGRSLPQIRSYEIWTPLSEYDHVEDISALMRFKLKAIRAHHSQMAEFPYDRAISGLNQYRGVIAGKCKFAEVFQTIWPG